MANSPTIDELSREELIVIVHEQQLQIEVLAKLFEQPGRKEGEGPFNRRQVPPEKPDLTVEAKAPSC